jgi:ribosomal protein S18 acetylase RimI-like enzyme
MVVSITLRPWKRSDRSKLQRWPAPNLPEHWGQSPPPAPTAGRPVSWAIEQGGHLVGRITQRDEVTVFGLHPWDVARISIYLHPDYYGQGIGTAALQQFLSLPVHIGIDSFRLYVAEDNRRALRCYQKCGFTVLRRVDHQLVEMEREHAPHGIATDSVVSGAVC